MKKLALCLLLAESVLAGSASAQIRVGPDINIGSQPVWGHTGVLTPAVFYDYRE